MRATITEIVGGVFVLVGIYLFVVNFTGTAQIIRTLGSQSVAGIRALQGR